MIPAILILPGTDVNGRERGHVGVDMCGSSNSNSSNNSNDSNLKHNKTDEAGPCCIGELRAANRVGTTVGRIERLQTTSLLGGKPFTCRGHQASIADSSFPSAIVAL